MTEVVSEVSLQLYRDRVRPCAYLRCNFVLRHPWRVYQAYLGWRVFDLTGSYHLSFIGLEVLALIGLVVAFYLLITDNTITGELTADP